MTDVLVVDDHPTVRDAVRMVLEGEGFVVHEAPDGPSALDAARRILPDLVILDLNLPGLMGGDVLAAMRADPALRAVPVVVVTALGEEGRRRALEAGADAYVTKPFGPSALLPTVLRALAGAGPPAG